MFAIKQTETPHK